MGKKNNYTKRYKGEVTIEQLLSARKKVFDNAKSLIEEGDILYSSDKFARAYFLYSIAAEELGKIFIIVNFITSIMNDDPNWKKFWRRYRNHKDKLSDLEMLEDFLLTDKMIEIDIKTYFDEFDNRVNTLDEFKMSSLYVDYNSNINDFVNPDELFYKDLVKLAKDTATNRIILLEKLWLPDKMFLVPKEEYLQKIINAKESLAKSNSI